MTYGITYTNGDIVLLPIPFTDLSSAKLRPAYVLAHCDEDIIVCGITSVIREGKYFVLINNLRILSQIDCTKIATIHQKLVIKKIGRASLETKSTVREILLELFH